MVQAKLHASTKRKLEVSFLPYAVMMLILHFQMLYYPINW